MHYIYKNNSDGSAFECDAADIMEADEKYLAHTGQKKIPSHVTTWSPDWKKQ